MTENVNKCLNCGAMFAAPYGYCRLCGSDELAEYRKELEQERRDEREMAETYKRLERR
jgi:rRNA maturation endonuclease Nob1